MPENLMTENKVAARIGRHRYLVARDRAAGHLTPKIEYTQNASRTVRLYTEAEASRYDAWLQKTHRAPYNRKPSK